MKSRNQLKIKRLRVDPESSSGRNDRLVFLEGQFQHLNATFDFAK